MQPVVEIENEADMPQLTATVEVRQTPMQLLFQVKQTVPQTEKGAGSPKAVDGRVLL